MKQKTTFGEFISQKRTSLKIPLREMSREIDISPEYLCNLENNDRINPSIEIMRKIIKFLCLNEEETELLYDLQAKASDNISMDLPEYIMGKDIARKAIRTAKKRSATDENWQEFIDKVENKAEN